MSDLIWNFIPTETSLVFCDEENCWSLERTFHGTDFLCEGVDNSAHKNICSQMRNSSFGVRLTKNILVKWREPIDVFSSPIGIKDKNLMLNVKCHCNNYSNMVIFKWENLSLTKKNPLKGGTFFPLLQSDVFSSIEYFYPKTKIFLFQLTEIDEKLLKKKTFHSIKSTNSKQNFTTLKQKIQWIRIEMTRRAAEFNGEFNEIRLKIQIEEKINISKTKFIKMTKKLTISQEKMRIQITEANAQFNEIRLRIEIEAKIAEKKTFGRENLWEFHKIFEFHQRKCIQFQFK